MNANAPMSSSLPKIIALMYHRIDDLDTNPWSVCVSPDYFEEQVRFLKNNFNVISTNEVINQIKTNSIIDNSVCLTFDDGYADNFSKAKPVLEAYHCPATFFIPTAFISTNKSFWWDELELIFLHSKQLSAQLSLSIGNKKFDYTLNENELTKHQWQQHKTWKWYEEPPTDRCATFINLWETLRPLPQTEIQQQMDTIRTWTGNNNYNVHRLPMNKQQLQQLSTNSLFTISIHTHTHPDLVGKEKIIQAEEILKCKQILLNDYGVESNCIAYPYGRYDEHTLEAVLEAKLAAGFTTEAIGINTHSQVAKLGRYQVFDWNENELKNEIAVWFTK